MYVIVYRKSDKVDSLRCFKVRYYLRAENLARKLHSLGVKVVRVYHRETLELVYLPH